MEHHLDQPEMMESLCRQLFVVVLIFTLSLGFLFYQSRDIIRQESVEEATHVLDNTALRLKGCMVEVETATRNTLWLIDRHQSEDSLLQFSHRVVSHQTISTDDSVGCNELAREVFDNARSLITPAAEMHLDSHVPDALTVSTNRHHLLIVLTELLFNALHFTRQGSVVMRIDSHDGAITFSVEDTGPGIPPDKADFVFEKFTKLDMFTDGLGLGLFLCRRVVQLMGGSLTLDTTYTGGCRFVLELPPSK